MYSVDLFVKGVVVGILFKLVFVVIIFVVDVLKSVVVEFKVVLVFCVL